MSMRSSRSVGATLSLLLALALAACGGEAAERSASERAEPGASATPAAERRSAAPTPSTEPAEAPRTVLFLGTSLTAGYGVAPEQAYPALIQAKIDSAGLPYRVVNAGVSGETSAGALRRSEWLLKQPFDVLVLETGANDMLRGMDLDSTRANLQHILDRVRAERPDAVIVLEGMMAPPNLGGAYTRAFQQIYPELAEENGVPLVPFLLEGVAGERALNLADGIHPNAAGQRRVAETVWATLGPVLEKRRDSGSGIRDSGGM
ncbi:MAG TPA: arylesterase [Longimicrobiaceae bacterium]|nr:arylesterase [Longimicrobiaceae bacterium]